MAIEKMAPECNLNTVKDGRGAILTFYPTAAPIVEWNLIFTRANESRGFHFHPEFDEYIMVTSGHGIYVTRGDAGAESFVKVAAGDCLHFPTGTPHTLYAISDMRMVALLTKRWNDCDQPLVRVN